MIVRFLALAAPCDYCGVKAGAMCRRPGGIVLRQVHSQRLRLAAATIEAGVAEALRGSVIDDLRFPASTPAGKSRSPATASAAKPRGHFDRLERRQDAR